MSSISIGELKKCFEFVDQATLNNPLSAALGNQMLGFVSNVTVNNEWFEINLELGINPLPSYVILDAINNFSDDYEVIVRCIDGSIGYINGFNKDNLQLLL